MAEIIMTFALGFLIASGIGLALLVPVWRRAVSVTRKRLHASSPVTLDDFNADKDRMRAEFAMSARKLEMSVENLRKKAETRLAELDKREREVAELKQEIGQKSGLSDKQGEEIAVLKQRLMTTEASLTRREQDLADLKERLSDAQNVLSRQAIAIREANSLVEGHKDEIDVLTSDIDSKAEEIAKKATALEEREFQLARCGRAVAEQKMLVGEMRLEITRHEQTVAQLIGERDAAVAVSATAAKRERELIEERDSARSALVAAETEIAALKESAARRSAEYANLAEAERRESALLRERLGDLAIEVDRASGDIDILLGTREESAAIRDAGSFQRNWSPASNLRALGSSAFPASADAVATAPGPSSLAERIRALSGIGAH